MYPGRRRRLSWNRVVFLLSALTICSLARFPIGTWSDSAPWRAKTGESLFSYGRRLLEVTGPGSARTVHPRPGNPNTGHPETGNPNTGHPETGNPNTGLPRAGNPNTGHPEIGNPNTGLPRAGNPNIGHPATWSPNTGHTETGNPNTAHAETGSPNTGHPEIGNPNTGLPRAGNSNTGYPETGSPNTGHTETRNPNTAHSETGSPNTGHPEIGNPNTGLPRAGNSNTGYPETGIPNTGLHVAGNPNTGYPKTGNPSTGHLKTGNPFTAHSRTGNPFTRHPGTGRPLSGVLGTRNPNTSFPGRRNPNTEVLGSGQPGSTLTRVPELWPHSTAAPSNQTSAAGRTSGMEREPAASEKPRLRGCILVGNEIVPAPGTAAPDGGEADRDDESGSSREPPLGHTKGEYPVDVFSVEERRRGWVLLHVLGMVYMFIALALVCDEFFVPSLGTITERLKISDDVAGATFMAAGGSAPELFTSLIGVFIAHSNVGIGTIVGSAVFNILFVIGMCAVFSREILHLTWWPLFRDVSFYILDLMLLIVFFLDNVIRWWESLCLLAGYLAYVGFMKYNGTIEIWFKRLLTSNTSVVKVIHVQEAIQEKAGSLGRKTKSNDSEPTAEEVTDNNRLKPKAVLMRGGSTPSLHNSTLRNTIFQLMINTLDPLTEEMITDRSVKASVSREQRVKFKQKAEVMNSMAKGRASRKAEQETRMKGGETEKTDLPNTVNVQVTPPSEPAATSPPGDKDDANPSQDPNEDQTGEDDGGDSSDGGSDGSDDDDDSDDSDDDSDDDEDEDEEESNDDEPLSLEWPETRRKQITYLCLLPIVFPLWLTVPDVRNPASKKYFIGTFFGSILWIGAFSYLMVWWAHQVGETIGISEEIMGLTILAAGTSIPDLITSVIVARKGLGDMAVSSSVGSNIFDITVGLPVPWLLYTTFNHFQPVPVSSNGLFCAIVLLFLMLLFVIISIGLSKWKMNKILGFIMFCLYFMFLIISVMLEDRIIVCPVSI
ncbi:sodium/potassium/calcium exchanger 1 [Mobula birostris]|uniref:sodium/potassium/calcium exchanger 1 n=1 Tax=Mobula birostris TaxID=1983395 RepID=UPI003B28705B